MGQKVITITSFADTESGKTFRELDFPKVTAALDEGYKVKEIKHVPLPDGGSSNRFVLTFLLEKE